MRVEELIKHLKTFPPKMIVCLNNVDAEAFYPIEKDEVYEAEATVDLDKEDNYAYQLDSSKGTVDIVAIG